MNTELITFQYRGEPVAFDPAARMWNLNAMHQAAGGASHKRPSEWLRQAQTRELVEALAEEEQKLAGIPASFVVTREGRAGGTWAHWQIAAAYAHYLDARFYLQWNRWAMERAQQLQAAPMLAAPVLPRPEAFRPMALLEARQVEELVQRIPECMEFTGNDNDRIEPYDLARGLQNRGVRLPCLSEFRGYLLVERALEILGVKRAHYMLGLRRKSHEHYWYGVRWTALPDRPERIARHA